MFILKSIYDYPDDLAIVSKSRGVLEEVALSLYEEDMYEWFCVLNEEEPNYIKFNSMLKEAKIRAYEMSLMYDITPATELEW